MWLLKAHGTSLAELGLLTLVGLPWMLKPLWAPLVDLHGTWQRWMGAASALAAAGILAFPWAGPAPVVPLLLLVAFASATQDIAVDGYLVARVPPEHQGAANGARVSGYRGAMALVGGVLLLPDRVGWPAAFAVVGVAQLLLAAVETRTAPAPRLAAQPGHRFAAGLALWLADRRRWPLFLFFLLYKLGDAAMAPMVKPFLLTRMELGQVGLLSTTAGAVLVAVGAFAGGAVLARLGDLRGILLLGAAQALSNLGYAAAAASSGAAAAVAASVAESFTGGLGTAATLGLAMRAAAGPQGATRFAVLSAVIGLTRIFSGAISGLAVERMGYSSWFATTFLLALPGLLLVLPASRALGTDEPPSRDPASP